MRLGEAEVYLHYYKCFCPPSFLSCWLAYLCCYVRWHNGINTDLVLKFYFWLMFSTYIDFCIGIHFRQAFGWKAICDRGKAYLLWRPSKSADAQCMSSLLGYLEVVYTMVHTSKYIRCTILASAKLYCHLQYSSQWAETSALSPTNPESSSKMFSWVILCMSRFVHVHVCLTHRRSCVQSA